MSATAVERNVVNEYFSLVKKVDGAPPTDVMLGKRIDAEWANISARQFNVNIFRPHQWAFDQNLLERAACSTVGSLVVDKLPDYAFKRKYKLTSTILDSSVLDEMNRKGKQFNLQDQLIEAIKVEAVHGRVLVYMYYQDGKFRFRPAVLKRHGAIFYKPNHDIDYYIVEQAVDEQTILSQKIPANAAILEVCNPDPRGSGHVGRSMILYGAVPCLILDKILESYAVLVRSRGISFVHVNAQSYSKPRLGSLRDMYEDISSYEVMFTNGKVKVEPVAAAGTGFKITDVLDAFLSIISASTGVPQHRLKGMKSSGASSSAGGEDSDQNSLSEVYSLFHNMGRPLLKKMYSMIMPEVNPEDYDVEWEYTERMDEVKKQRLRAMTLQNLLTGRWFIPAGMALTDLYGENPYTEMTEEELDMPFGIWATKMLIGYAESEDLPFDPLAAMNMVTDDAKARSTGMGYPVQGEEMGKVKQEAPDAKNTGGQK